MEGIIDKENERVRRFFALLDNMPSDQGGADLYAGWV